VFTYNESENGNVLIKSWTYPESNEMDLEIWVDGEYTQTLTVNLSLRNVWYQLLEQEEVA
jgi:hypothetical protein